MYLPLFVVVVTILATFALATTSNERAVIISYPKDTPDSILDESKASIRAAGGVITHEYKLIKAFAAKASTKSLETMQMLKSKYNVIIEDDQMVHAMGDAF